MKFTSNARLRATISAVAVATLLGAGFAMPVLAAEPVTAGVTGERILLAGKMKVRGQRIYGGSPYICTPSGFGQKARCFLRSTIA
jgi:hypothetical protein